MENRTTENEEYVNASERKPTTKKKNKHAANKTMQIEMKNTIVSKI